MTTAADFPNLKAPIWDRIRVKTRETPTQIAERMCRHAQFDPDMVRTSYPARKTTPKGLVELRCRIMVAISDAGYSWADATEWFQGIAPRTLEKYLSDGRKAREVENA